MEKILVRLIIIVFCLILSVPAKAEISVGYETLTILPHAFVMNYWDKESGWGAKASADFGTSAFSVATSLLATIFSLGNPANVSFFTLVVTKDFHQGANYRDYIKAGGVFLSAQGSGARSTVTLPEIGYGWEWQNFLRERLSGNIEIAYPEILTLGLRYHF